MSSCSTPWQLVRRNRSPHAGPADEDRALSVAAADRLAHLARLVRVVDPRLGRVGAEIDRVVSQLLELGQHALPQLHAAVVEGNRDLHQDRYVTRDD
jgi:hypothetical protein